MAAIFALVFVPAIGAVLFMLGGLHGQLSLGTLAATTMFVALCVGAIGGLFKMSREWDAEEQH
ncbi:MAG: hypothetical protein QM831_28665 [Kofleriaceae bacterium]